MPAPRSIHSAHGFTLVEALLSLGLCALLATTVASAVAFSVRAERMAAGGGDASLLVPSLYAAQRLRANELPTLPRGWKFDRSIAAEPAANGRKLEWHELAIVPAGREIPPFVLRILKDSP